MLVVGPGHRERGPAGLHHEVLAAVAREKGRQPVREVRIDETLDPPADEPVTPSRLWSAPDWSLPRDPDGSAGDEAGTDPDAPSAPGPGDDPPTRA